MKGILFVLKRHELGLAETEAKAAVHGWRFWDAPEEQQDGMIFFPDKKKIDDGLGLTRRVLKVLEVTTQASLPKVLSEMKWDRILSQKPYKVVVTKRVQSDTRSLKLAEVIWKAQKNPKVNLKNPEIIVEIVITSKKSFVCLQEWVSDEEFSERRAHVWPAPHPSAMHPSVARALLNISCAKRIHDPFCGAGGFLIEAGIAGMKVSGADIESDMVDRARKNIAHFKARANIKIADATDWIPEVQAIVTDLPYGKSTRSAEINGLVKSFLERAAKSTERVVMGLSVKKSSFKGWKVRVHLSSYVHRSITRHFYVLERD